MKTDPRRSDTTRDCTQRELGWIWRASIFVLTLFFFSNVAQYGFLFQGWPLRPSAIFASVVIFFSVFIYARTGLTALGSSLAYWCVSYVAVSMLSFVVFGGASLPFLLGAIYAALFLLFFFALYSVHADAVRTARIALACGVCLAAICNAYEVANPSAFLPPGSFSGRAAALYINPNQAGAAIVLGTVLGIGVVPARLRWVFLTVSLGAVVLTLSRAAIIGWCAVVGAQVVVGVLRAKTAIASIATTGLAGYAAWILIGQVLLENRGINLELLRERVSFFTTVAAIPDASQLERTRVAEKAFLLFEDNFLFGRGLGSTIDWSDSASTHNMYLFFMADFGLVGMIVYPALVYVAVRGRNPVARPHAIAFACFALLWGLFSHNIVGELYSLLSFAVIAAWVRVRADSRVPRDGTGSRRQVLVR